MWRRLARGRRRWLLWPPASATYAHRHVKFALNASVRAVGAPLLCEQRAGDVILLPALWGHSTFNTEPSIGFATELNADRTFDLGSVHADGDEDEWLHVGSSDLDGRESLHSRSIDKSVPPPLPVPVSSRANKDAPRKQAGVKNERKRTSGTRREAAHEVGADLTRDDKLEVAQLEVNAQGQVLQPLAADTADISVPTLVRDLERDAAHAEKLAAAAQQHAKVLRHRAQQAKRLL